MHRYSYRIEQAIRAASILHKNQTRKGEVPYPYVTHTFAVAMIVADYTDAEDTIVAALLHDTLEDTDYTEEEIHEDFGPNVRDIVVALTKPRMPEDTPWKETRKEYLKKLKGAKEEALIVAAADKLHNMRTMVESYYDMPGELVNDFGGSLEERLMLYQEISNIFNRTLTNPITHEFNHVFEEFKQFILLAQKQKDEEAASS